MPMTSPNVERAALASASSMRLRPNDDNVVVAAVPEPVKYGMVSAELVTPAKAESSASYA